MSSTSAGQVGRLGEQMAARHLQQSGYRIVARNWRPAARELRGELDLVALEGHTLVFCEVKARRTERSGPPLGAVTPRKQAQLRRLASAFLAAGVAHADSLRFDVVGITWPADGGPARLDHIRGAW